MLFIQYILIFETKALFYCVNMKLAVMVSFTESHTGDSYLLWLRHASSKKQDKNILFQGNFGMIYKVIYCTRSYDAPSFRLALNICGYILPTGPLRLSLIQAFYSTRLIFLHKQSSCLYASDLLRSFCISPSPVFSCVNSHLETLNRCVSSGRSISRVSTLPFMESTSFQLFIPSRSPYLADALCILHIERFRLSARIRMPFALALRE